MYRGVFWIIENRLAAFPFTEKSNIGISKSGVTFNHKKLWPHIRPKGCNKPYNYYPRGRVDFSNKGNPIIYMNPNVDESFLPEIKSKFGLQDTPTIKIDNSEHYKCYLDTGWKADDYPLSSMEFILELETYGRTLNRRNQESVRKSIVPLHRRKVYNR